MSELVAAAADIVFGLSVSAVVAGVAIAVVRDEMPSYGPWPMVRWAMVISGVAAVASYLARIP